MAAVKGRRVESAALRVTYGHPPRPEILTTRLPSLPNYAGLGATHSFSSLLDLFANLHLHITPTVCARTTHNEKITLGGGLVNDEESERQTVTRQHVRGNQSLDHAPCRQEEHHLNSGVTRSY